MSDRVVWIRIAKSAGFCFGVKRAIDIALQAAEENENVFMLGDIVHNEFVVEQIRQAGIRIVEDIDEIGDGVLLLRAHGTVPEIYRKAEERGLRIVDATCPMVIEIHRIVRKLADEGYTIVIIGDRNHDEVRGIAAQVSHALVISTEEDLREWRRAYRKIGVVVQSTQNIEKVQQILNRLIPFCRELRFMNTICKPTTDHQNEIRQMPRENDVMIIVGSFTSANTRRLTELSAAINPRTYQVPSAAELRADWFEGCATIGISAGASTPDELIRDVVHTICHLVAGAEVEAAPEKPAGNEPDRK
ncbi:MAG: 4-hydroxy-3-methylbut-2-enyl diphosphate reductase [Acidobacteria bacterium]|nr:4-hydroxy-3-methylbut-2-enyl diphosphate reductase [Acidobacteriota bacterium]